MSGVTMVTVSEDDGTVRLDRWFRRHYPQVTQGQIQKLLRTKQIKVDGKRAEASQRISAGQIVRVPPLPERGSPMAAAKARKEAVQVSQKDAEFVQSLIIYKDKDVIVLNKPSGLAVQGGSGLKRHLDGMLSALRFEKDENPRLVHRLDKDTSGVLVLGRTAAATAKLAEAFRSRDAKNILGFGRRQSGNERRENQRETVKSFRRTRRRIGQSRYEKRSKRRYVVPCR